MQRYYWFGFWIFFVAIATVWWSYHNYEVKPHYAKYDYKGAVYGDYRYPASEGDAEVIVPPAEEPVVEKKGFMEGLDQFYSNQESKSDGYAVCHHFAINKGSPTGMADYLASMRQFHNMCKPKTATSVQAGKFTVVCCDKAASPFTGDKRYLK